MAQYLNDDLEYLVEDYFDMIEFDDGEFEEGGDQLRNDEDADLEDVDSKKQKNDTTASEFRNGKDIQGIPWERLNYTRETYREMRLKQYKNYENNSISREELEKECKQVEKGSTFYDFQFNTRLVKSTIVHFQHLHPQASLSFHEGNRSRMELLSEQLTQLGDPFHMLRNLLWATSKHDVYMMQNYSVMHWSSLLQTSKEVLNVAGKIVPTQKPRGSSAQPISRVQISTIAVKDNLIVAGGFQGELICKYLDHPGVAFCAKITEDANAITNAVDIYQTSNGSLRVTTANNDCHVRIFDTQNFSLLNCVSFPWSVNSTSASPDGKLLAVLGDSTECLLADAQSGRVIGNLKGHLDYSFASAWHPDGRILATGNQDKTCRLWDVRNLSESFAVLKGRMGAIRGIKFSSDGRFMAMAEPADFVHVYDARADYCKAQEIDLFGEIGGLSFSPDAEALFVGVADRTYGSLLEFGRRHQYHYLDSFL